nr:PaaI family thioesterase [Croceicoccus gelatinilyticus]
MRPFGPFHELVGTMFIGEREGQRVIGMRVEERHRNAGAMMHGGMMLTFADTAMTLAALKGREPGMVTVTMSMSSDFLAPARVGDWIEANVEILRSGRTTKFLNCIVRRDGPDGPALLRCSGVFQMVPARPVAD